MEREPFLSTCRGGDCPRGRMSAEEQPHGSGYGNCIYVHAEINALNNFRNQVDVRHTLGWARRIGVVLYVSSKPCEDCMKYAEWADCKLVWRE